MLTFRYKRKLVKFLYLLVFAAGLLAPLAVFFVVPGIDPVTALLNGAPGLLVALLAIVNYCRGVYVTRDTIWFLDSPLAVVGIDGIREISMTRVEIGLSILTADGKTVVHTLGKRPWDEDIEVLRKLAACLCERVSASGRGDAVNANVRQFISESSGYHEQRLADAQEQRNGLSGLGGWLGMLCAYMIFTVVVNLIGLAIGPSEPVSGANGQFISVMDLLVTAASSLLAAWALYCFFRRKKTFPRNMLLYYGASMLAMLSSGFISNVLTQNSVSLESVVSLAVGLVMQGTRFFALRGYLRHSLRVRNTFVM